jgi:pimeloyl-ACP methyl ester carboxylesterase
MRLLLAIASLAAAALAAIEEGELPPASKRDDPIVYAINTPHDFDKTKPAPLILALHAGRGTAKRFAAFFTSVAEAQHAILACPQGFEEILGGDGYWWKVSADEVAALDRFVEFVRKRYVCDPARFYVIGLADGGELAARYALSKDRGVKGLILLNILWKLEGQPKPGKDLKVVVGACREAQEKLEKLQDHAERAQKALFSAKLNVLLRLYAGASRGMFREWEEEFRKSFEWFDGKRDWPAEIAGPPPPPK